MKTSKDMPPRVVTQSVEDADQRAWYPLVLIFAVLVLGISAGGTLSYRTYERRFRTGVEQGLAAIAELKVNDLALWRKERLGDANIIFKNVSFSGLVRRFLDRPGDAEAQAELRAWLERCQAAYHYERIFLLDAQGVERMSTAGTAGPAAAVVSRRAGEILRSREIGFQDFYRDEHDQRIYLATLAPILEGPDPSQALGVLVLHIDPATYFYSFLNRWPTPSRTAETLLVRRDGKDALFLNELKFQTNTALKLRIPLERTNVAGVKAALGQEGIVEGTDYRGEPVVAALRAIPDSPWSMVARMDTAEVYAPLRERLWLTVLLMGALLLGAAASVGLVWRQQRVQYYRGKAVASETLRETQSRLQAIMDQTPALIYAMDLDGRFISVNRQLEVVLGQPANALLGQTRHAFLPRHIADEHRANDLEVMRTGQPVTVEESNDGPDGRRTYLSTKFPLYAAAGAVNGICGISTDITERKQAEVALRASRERLREVNALQVLLLPSNPVEKKAKLVTDAVVQTVGADFARVWMIRHGDRCETGCIHAQVTEGPQVCRFRDRCLHLLASSGRYTHTDGRDHSRVPFGCYKVGKIAAGEESGFLTNEVPTDPRVHNHAWAKELGLVSFAGYRLSSADGWPVGVLALFSKEAISAEKDLLLQGIAHVTSQVLLSARAEEGLRESEERFRRAVVDSPFPILLHAEDGAILQASNSWCEITGYNREELATIADWTERAYGERKGAVQADIDRLYRLNHRVADGDHSIRTKRGDTRIWDFSSAPLGRLPDGRRLAISMAIDVTERRAAEREVRRLNAELEQRVKDRTAQLEVVNKELEGFSYSVSHDLRAPLRAIDGFARILGEDYTARLDDEGRRLLGVICGEAKRMGQLIDDLLAFSRMNRQQLEPAQIDMAALAQAVFGEHAAQAPGRQLRFKVQPLPPAQGDHAMLRQALANLISNAIKYTRPRAVAEIEIGGRTEGEENIYYVKDNGVGFDMKYAGKLFGVFQRLHTEDEFEGTGVGLALVQRVIHRHGGRVWAEAKLNEGATFYFTLPMGKDRI
jgi:PAS domain S-box-containing protein